MWNFIFDYTPKLFKSRSPLNLHPILKLFCCHINHTLIVCVAFRLRGSYFRIINYKSSIPITNFFKSNKLLCWEHPWHPSTGILKLLSILLYFSNEIIHFHTISTVLINLLTIRLNSVELIFRKRVFDITHVLWEIINFDKKVDFAQRQIFFNRDLQLTNTWELIFAMF